MNSAIEFARAGALWLLAWSWQVLLLLGAVWLMLQVGRVKAAVVRHQLWLAGLIAVALLPLCSFVARQLPQPKAAAENEAPNLQSGGNGDESN